MGYDFDLVVVGSGPAGQKAAIQAAKLGRRAAVVDRGHMMGGVCINTGTIPSKTLREAVLYLTGMNQRGIYGQSYRVKADITAHDLLWRMTHMIGREVDVVRNQLGRNPCRSSPVAADSGTESGTVPGSVSGTAPESRLAHRGAAVAGRPQRSRDDPCRTGHGSVTAAVGPGTVPGTEHGTVPGTPRPSAPAARRRGGRGLRRGMGAGAGVARRRERDRPARQDSAEPEQRREDDEVERHEEPRERRAVGGGRAHVEREQRDEAGDEQPVAPRPPGEEAARRRPA